MDKEKTRFKGRELKGKVLGVVGLGAIGSRVANLGLSLGMDVIGYDPAISVEAAWRLSSSVRRMENLTSLLARADYISLHLPAIEATRNLINSESGAAIKEGACLLNFAREEIVDTDAIVELLSCNKLRTFISDFPHPKLIGLQGAVLMPHIGASTDEAEENCAVMAAKQLKAFLEDGNVANSVNFPALELERREGWRLCISNRNVPKMLGNILSILADRDINVIDMLNKSREDIAYNLIDIGSEPDDDMIAQMEAVDGVINVRVLG